MSDLAQRRRVLIMGSAGRDFHNFLCCYRDDPQTEVVAFTATQIPSIAGRRYPASCAGPSYPEGRPIDPETDLEGLIARHHVDEVVFAYSDAANQTVMLIAQPVLAAGANFTLPGPHATMLASQVPIIAVFAVRTECGKSAVTRRVVALLRQHGFHPVVVRYPMPYSELAAQGVQRFATLDNLDRPRQFIDDHVQEDCSHLQHTLGCGSSLLHALLLVDEDVQLFLDVLPPLTVPHQRCQAGVDRAIYGRSWALVESAGAAHVPKRLPPVLASGAGGGVWPPSSLASRHTREVR